MRGDFGGIMQLGHVVADLDAAMAGWVARGVGPFFVADDVPYAEVQYRGQPIRPRTAVALAQAGPLQIELIRPVGSGPSVFGDFLARRGGGLHHVCALSSDLDADLARWATRGVGVLQGGRTTAGIPFAYLDTDPDDRGAVLELVQPTPGLLRFFQHIRDAAEGWDGTDPVRRL